MFLEVWIIFSGILLACMSGMIPHMHVQIMSSCTRSDTSHLWRIEGEMAILVLASQ